MEKQYTRAAIKSKGERAFEFTMSSNSVDRDGDVIEPDGMRIPRGKTNIPVLWAHGRDSTRGQLPIGKISVGSIGQDGRRAFGTVELDEGDPFAALVANKLRSGSLDSGSIGFHPIDYDRDKVADGQTGFHIKTWELLEFSVVPVPANADALRRELQFASKALQELERPQAHPDMTRLLPEYYSELDQLEQMQAQQISELCNIVEELLAAAA